MDYRQTTTGLYSSSSKTFNSYLYLPLNSIGNGVWKCMPLNQIKQVFLSIRGKKRKLSMSFIIINRMEAAERIKERKVEK